MTYGIQVNHSLLQWTHRMNINFLKARTVITKFLLTKFWIRHRTRDRRTRGSGGAERQTDCSVHPPTKTSAPDGFRVRHPGGWIDGSDRLLSGRRKKVAARVRVPTFGNHQLHGSVEKKSLVKAAVQRYILNEKRVVLCLDVFLQNSDFIYLTSKLIASRYRQNLFTMLIIGRYWTIKHYWKSIGYSTLSK